MTLTVCRTALLILVLTVPALAQQRIAVSGVVTDISGAVVPGASIEAAGGGRTVAVATTGADGRYRVELPAGGPYVVRARRQGFADETMDVAGTGDVTLDLTLRLAAIGDTLVVTAARTAETRAGTTASVAVFSSRDVAALGAHSIADVLRAVPGLNLEATGREGAMTSLFSRGGESDYNLVLVDGVRVNSTGGVFDFSRIAAAGIDRVEVVRGGQSALYGSDAMGAVVQVFTKRAGASDPPQVVGSIESGSFNTWRGDAMLLGGAGHRADYKVGLSYRGTRGAFADILPEDDRFDQTTVDLGAGAALGDRASIRAGLRYSEANGRAVGAIDFGARDTGTEAGSEDLSLHIGVNHRWSANVTGVATLAYARANAASIDAIADPVYDLFAILEGTPGAIFPAGPRLVRLVDEPTFAALAAAGGPGAGRFLARTPFGIGDFTFTSRTHFRRPAFKYHADWTWRPAQSLAGGYEFERESDPLNAGFEISNHAYFAQQQFRLRDRWIVTFGARVDDNSHYGTHVSPKLSLGGHLLPHTDGGLSSVKVFSNLGTGVKNPTFSELFDTGFTDGNRGLTPERARTVDVGAEATFAAQRLRATLTYFDNSYEDQVAFRSTGIGRDGRPDYVNIAGSDASGWEIEAALQRPLHGLTAAASYAFVDTSVTAAMNTSPQFQPGQPLLRRPKHSGFLRFGYLAGPATVNVDVRLVGERHDSIFLGLMAAPSGQSVDITVNPGYTLIGLGAEYALREEVALFLRIDNLADEAYANVLGYPGLPRSGVVGVRFGVGRR